MISTAIPPLLSMVRPMLEREVAGTCFRLLSRFGHFPDLVENQAKTSLPEAVWLYSNLTPTAPYLTFFA
jgi:hypothetical protein